MAHLETPPQRSGGSARKVRELLGVDLAVAEEASPPPPPSVTLPVRLPRGPNSHEMAPKYETRVYTPTMGTLFDLSVQGKHPIIRPSSISPVCNPSLVQPVLV